MRFAITCACLVVGCTSSGSLELELSLPQTAALRPTGMSTVTVIASSPDMTSIENTSVITGGTTSTGDLPVSKNVQIDVLLRDVSSRLVGIGEASEPVDIKGDSTTTLTIPVRRPFVYASDGTTLYTFDASLDPRDPMFQGKLAGLDTPQIAVSVGGDRLVVAGPSALQIVDTATNMVIGKAVAMPSGAMISDIAPVPGQHIVAVAHSMGISIVDIDAATVQSAAVGPVDRVTVGPGTDGAMIAYGLVSRVVPPQTPLDACMGASSLVAVEVTSPTVTMPKPLSMGVSAIAASPTTPDLFATLPCAGQVAKITGVGSGEITQLTLDNVTALEGAAVVAVLDDRVWAAGTHASTAVCDDGSGVGVACPVGTAIGCPEPTETHLAYVTDGAHLIVDSIPLAGGDAITVDLPERRETMVSTDDAAQQHAQVLHSLGILPVDLVAQPGGEYVSIVATSEYYIESLKEEISGDIILPCLQATTGDWMVVDLASTSVADRVRTQCALTVGPAMLFPHWACDAPPDGEANMFDDYTPATVGALFGAR